MPAIRQPIASSVPFTFLKQDEWGKLGAILHLPSIVFDDLVIQFDPSLERIVSLNLMDVKLLMDLLHSTHNSFLQY
jgi:hypothetical protein